MLRQQFNQASAIRHNVNRPRFDLGQNTLMDVVDLEG